jgi:Mobilization protein NikA
VAKKRLGRPKMAPGNRRSKWVLIRLTPGEHRKLKSVARKNGMTMAELLRQVVLHQTGDGGESTERRQK